MTGGLRRSILGTERVMEFGPVSTHVSEDHTDDWQWRRQRLTNTLYLVALLIVSWGLVARLIGVVRRVS